MLAHYTDLFRLSAAASDVGFFDWLRTALVSGALTLFVRYTLNRLTHAAAVAK